MPEPLTMRYTNRLGITTTRRVTPIGDPYFGTTALHNSCWLLPVFDHDKGAEQDYPFTGCDFTGGGA